jgi:ferric enterobactin receptor
MASDLDWNTNFTYMIESKDKDTGDPLSIISKYIINTTLDWCATEQFSMQLNVTHYGKQKASSCKRRTHSSYDASTQKDIDPYILVRLSSGYEFNETTRCVWV